jgi:hypothetical protein
MKQEFITTDKVETCPICKAKQLPEDQQPQSGLHAYTIKYECGAQVVCAFGYDSATVDLKCGEVKEDLIDTLIACRNVEEKYFQDQMQGIYSIEGKVNRSCLIWLCSLTNSKYKWKLY